jgi:hypothetical protein
MDSLQRSGRRKKPIGVLVVTQCNAIKKQQPSEKQKMKALKSPKLTPEQFSIIKAHEVTGQVTLREHYDKMHRAVQKAVSSDERFCIPANQQSQSGYKPTPYVVDLTTPNEVGKHHAIIQTAKGELVRHGFDFNKDAGTATMLEGASNPTERTTVYAARIEAHENMVKASENIISCRFSAGTKLEVSEPWAVDKSVSFIYAPGGISTITAGFRQKETITCTIEVDENTASALQESFDYICATDKQEPYADEDHEAKKATLRFPADKVKFSYGMLKSHEGCIVTGPEPTSYGAESVNGKVYRSWSGEFATDANYAKASCKKGHWTFPDGIRGSESNPAHIIALNFVTGALTNKPAFKNMPPVKAKKAEPEAETKSKFIIAAHEADKVTLNDLQSSVCKAAEADERFTKSRKEDGKDGSLHGVWCCDIIFDKDEDKWTGVIRAANGKLYEVPFTISEDDASISLGTEAKEVTRKTEYVEACDKSDFLLNGNIIKAGAPIGNKNAAGKRTWADTDEHKQLEALGGMHMRPDWVPADHLRGIKFADPERQKHYDDLIEQAGPGGHVRALVDKKTDRFIYEHKSLQSDMVQVDGNDPISWEEFCRQNSDSPEHNAEIKKHLDSGKEYRGGGGAAAKFTVKKYVKTTNATPTPLETIFARKQAEHDRINTIASKSPTLAAREAAARIPPDKTLETIVARKNANLNFQERILAKNPLAANREALSKIKTKVLA